MEMDSNRLPEGPLPRKLADRYMSIVRRHAYRLARRLPSHVNVEDLMGASFRINNPNAASSCGCGNSFSIG